MRLRTKVISGALMLLPLSVALGGCTTSAPAATPVATPQPTPNPTLATPVAHAKQLYATYCATCHGPEAQGTDIAPALPGHSESVVKRQVRTPIGKMRPFPPSIISDQDLEEIASFIAGLPAPEEHVEPVDMEEALAVHHWMAIYVLKNGDTRDALHHIGHILEMTSDAELRHRIEEVKELVEQGEVHDAEHELSEMLSGKADPNLTLSKLHLKLALAAVGQHDAHGAVHHMEHFMAVAGEAATEGAHEVLELLNNDELHEAEHEIEELLEAQ